MNVEDLKAALLGKWVSIAPEVRPSKNPDGTLKPFFLSRSFVYMPEDRFALTVVNYAHAFGTAPIAKIDIGGRMFWRGEHPIVFGAQKVDFVADRSYSITPLIQTLVDRLNEVVTDGYDRWILGRTQSVFGKSFPPFGLVRGENFKEYDLVVIARGMLFWGARNVDGRGFDTEANRPTNLQIPLVRG